MADKKKKVFTFKESTTPRRPVILKSDRETSKEPAKDKDKQPTIILKTREQGANKDDDTNSRLPAVDTDSQPKVPSDKEKKSIEQKPTPPLKLMPSPLKLIDENQEFNSAALEYLLDSSNHYLVVGIIGMQGVGKSMMLNLIGLDSPVSDLCNQVLQSHILPEKIVTNNDAAKSEDQEDLDFVKPDDKTKAKDNNIFKFKMQDIDQIERGVHCTKGIDMYVTNDRVILLDCQALWSPSLLAESSSSPVSARSANIVTVDCLQLASFLMAVCHVLIATQDWFTDYNFIRYIQTAEMLKPSLSASSVSQETSETASLSESPPHLLIMHNRCQLEDFTADSVKAMQDFYKKAFQRSNLRLNSGMYLYSDTNKNCLNIDSVCRWYNTKDCGTPINLFLMPEIYEDHENKEIYRGHPPFEQLAERLRQMVLGVNRHQITNVANLSERGWFQYCNKAWETIKKCKFFMEYERFLP